MSDDVCEVIITAADAEWLATFTRHLVDKKLAAATTSAPFARSIGGTTQSTTRVKRVLRSTRDAVWSTPSPRRQSSSIPTRSPASSQSPTLEATPTTSHGCSQARIHQFWVTGCSSRCGDLRWMRAQLR